MSRELLEDRTYLSLDMTYVAMHVRRWRKSSCFWWGAWLKTLNATRIVLASTRSWELQVHVHVFALQAFQVRTMGVGTGVA